MCNKNKICQIPTGYGCVIRFYWANDVGGNIHNMFKISKWKCDTVNVTIR